ncbi:hypothetical protein MP228_009426 [Amoeboaphelidium protococcarum]|nr:hypothetical protein MP228_009426 [Amoeboaphelidium protococcarum]
MPTKEEQFLSACKLELDLQNAQESGLILEGQHVNAILTIDTSDGIKMLPQAYTNEQILAGIVDRLEIKVSTVIGENTDLNLSWYQGSDSPRIGVTFWVNSADNKAVSFENGLIIKVPLKVKFGHCIDVLDDDSLNEFNAKILVQILLKPKSVQLKDSQRFVSHLENPSVRRSLSLEVKVCRPYAIQCHRVGTSHLIVQLDAFFALQLLKVQVITFSGSYKSDNQQLLQLDARESWSLLFRNILSNNEQVVCLRVDSRLDVDIVSYYTVRFGNNELVDIYPVKDLNSVFSSTSIEESPEIDRVRSLKVCLSSNRVIVDSDGYFSLELVVTNCTSEKIISMSVQILDDGSEFHGSSLSNNGRNAMDVWIDTPDFLLQWSEQMASNWQSTIVQCPTSLQCVRHFPVMNQMEPLSVSKSENSQLLQESYQYEYFEQIVSSSSSKLKPLQNIPRLRKLREALLATAAKCLRRGIGHYQFHMQVYSVSVQSCIEALQTEESRQDAHLIEAELFKCLSHLVGPLLDDDDELVRRQQKQSGSNQQLSLSALSVNDAATQFSQVKVLDWTCVWELYASNQICNNLLNSAPLTFISSYHQSYAPQLSNTSSQKMDTEINQCIMNCIELYIAIRDFNVVQIAANLDNLNPLTRQYVQYQMRNKLWQRQVLCLRRAFVKVQMDDLLAFLKGYSVDKSQVIEFLKLNKILVSDDGVVVQFVVPRSTNK